jgi:hypothetical protein
MLFIALTFDTSGKEQHDKGTIRLFSMEGIETNFCNLVIVS